MSKSEIRVSVGGTAENPVFIDAASVTVVKAAEIAASGNVLKALALNVLAGTVDPELLSKDGQKIAFSSRAVKDSKTAFNKLLSCKASDIRAAWEVEQSSRKRLTEPTLQALARLMREPGAAPAEPLGKLIAAILAGKGTATTKIKAIEALPAMEKYMGDGAVS